MQPRLKQPSPSPQKDILGFVGTNMGTSHTDEMRTFGWVAPGSSVLVFACDDDQVLAAPSPSPLVDRAPPCLSQAVTGSCWWSEGLCLSSAAHESLITGELLGPLAACLASATWQRSQPRIPPEELMPSGLLGLPGNTSADASLSLTLLASL